MTATVSTSKRGRIQFSLRTLLVCMALFGVLSALGVYIVDRVRNAEVYLQLRDAREWHRKLPSDGKCYSFNIWIEGKNFAVSNTICEYRKEVDGWVVNSKSKILSDKLFAFPPGVEVESIDEAYLAFQRHLALEKAGKTANASAK